MKNNLFDVIGMFLMLGVTVLMEVYFSALFRLNVLMDNYIGVTIFGVILVLLTAAVFSQVKYLLKKYRRSTHKQRV
ncbi:hypothetical protein [Listeria monocytogenes]|uniref:hypothetical protein n=1 Tax=Listeria monocytogenes TaxID=1639 RepID=UPI0010BA70BB|nr:hypothetical protein [Listeria monocytogenes]HBN5068620.1 hypothetical protein [Listeria innocua]EAD2781193.1 hypothetical protein [Listeria monocytogenes]EAD4818781.1 hypothetical protein [Listeria monocytogenes]EAE2608957.1 hypothetical protein [Listeria monocytogenes]EAE4446707.1 hypothetical protein [Listeria monocytogenes]